VAQQADLEGRIKQELFTCRQITGLQAQ